MADSHKHHHNHHDEDTHDGYHRRKGNGRKGGKGHGKDRDRRREREAEAAPLPVYDMTDEELEATPFGQLGLSPTMVKAVLDMSYADPTPVQEQAIPEVLAGHDVMAAAQTGTGKTAAFLLPVLDHLPHAGKGQGPLMLVVTPTRELAQQIEAVATSVCRRTGHTHATVVGGVSYNPQRSALKRGCDLLVATPGRLIDLMEQGACNLDQVQVLVLDEADRMLDMGFLPDMRKIVEKTPEDRQTLMFSATLDRSVLEHTRDLVKDPVSIEIAHKGTTADTVEQYVIATEHLAKANLLLELLRQEGSKRVIVFINSKHRADTIAKKLRKEGITCDTIHGDRSQHQRMEALAKFRTGEVDVLVATDVLSRGIDVPDVSYVINFDVPYDDPEDYIHRIGRTGRAGEEGWAVTLVDDEDYLSLRYVEQLLGKVIPPFPRTDGLTVGDEPVELDPDRDPDERLPKKSRGKHRKHQEKSIDRKASNRKRRGGKGHGKKKSHEADATKESKGSESAAVKTQSGEASTPAEASAPAKKDAGKSAGSHAHGKPGTAKAAAGEAAGEAPLNRSERRALKNTRSSRIAAMAKSEESWSRFKNHGHRPAEDDQSDARDGHAHGRHGKRDDRRDGRDDSRGGYGSHGRHASWDDGRDDRSYRSDRDDDRRGGKHGKKGRHDNGADGREETSFRDYRHHGKRQGDERQGRHFADRHGSEGYRSRDNHDSRGRNGYGRSGNGSSKGSRGSYAGRGRAYHGKDRNFRLVSPDPEAVYRPGKGRKRSSRHPGDHGGRR